MEIFAYRTDVFAGPPIDITGFDVEASDSQRLGTVDESTYDDGLGCLVVDTGFWIFGKRRLLPAGVVMSVDPEARKVYVSMTRDEIKNAPDYNAERHENEPDDYHDEVGPYYDQYR